MMSADDLLKIYMKRLEISLSDVDKARKKSILNDVKENIGDKVAEYRSTKSSGRPLKDSEMEMILDNFGDPEEIALNYKMHAPEEQTGRSISIPWMPILITAVIISILLISTIAAMFFIFVDEEDQEETIYIGEGLDEVKVNDGMDEILLAYGEPEERVETDTTVWLSYRSEHGLDFLLTKDTEAILEIRMNEGFEGKTEEGIGIGDDLDDVFLKISEPELSVDANWSDTHSNSEGGDRVLYNQMEGGGNVLAFKYIDEKKGVLFWADSDRSITQIVIFKPYEVNTVDVINVECTISANTETITIDIITGKVTWDQMDVMVDGKFFETGSSSTSGGNSASFSDPDGEFDAVSGEEYNVKIIIVAEKKVVCEMDIIAN